MLFEVNKELNYELKKLDMAKPSISNDLAGKT